MEIAERLERLKADRKGKKSLVTNIICVSVTLRQYLSIVKQPLNCISLSETSVD